MSLLYGNPGGMWRHHLSLAIVIGAVVWGLYELWFAYIHDGGELDWMFGVGFVAGGAYGLWQVMNETRDRVITFHRDDATGETVTTMWRPFMVQRIRTTQDRIGNWRFHVKIGGRNSQTFFIYADSEDYPRSLQFELTHKVDREGLRRVAPEAVAEYEERFGLNRPSQAPVE